MLNENIEINLCFVQFDNFTWHSWQVQQWNGMKLLPFWHRRTLGGAIDMCAKFNREMGELETANKPNCIQIIENRIFKNWNRFTQFSSEKMNLHLTSNGTHSISIDRKCVTRGRCIVTEKTARVRVSIFESLSWLPACEWVCVCVWWTDGHSVMRTRTVTDLWRRALIHIDITILITEWHLLRKHIIIYHIVYFLFFLFCGYFWWFRFTFTAHDNHRKRRRRAPSNYAMRAPSYHFHVAAFQFGHIRIMIIIY